MRLTDRLLLALGVTALVPLGFALLVGYSSAESVLERGVESRFGAVADMQEARYQEFWRSAQGAMESVVADEALRGAYLDHRAAPGDTTRSGDLLARLRSVVSASPVLRDLSITAPSGVVDTSTRPEVVGGTLNLTGAPAAGEGAIIRIGKVTGDWRVYLLSGMTWEGAPGWVIGHLAPDLFASWAETYPDRGRTGEVLYGLPDAGGVGRMLAASRLDPSITMGASVGYDWIVPMERALAGEDAYLKEIRDQRGAPVAAMVRGLDGGVGLVVKMDVEEAYAPVVDLQVQTVAAVFTFLVVLGGTAAWVSFTVSRPLVSLTARAKEISGGRHERRIFPSGDDELRVLAESVNRLASRLEEAERTLTERVRAATAELRRSNQELEQFAYVASHDLKEPIRMVHSYLSLIERRFPERIDEELGQFLGYAKDGAERMQRLVDDLLVYSRVGRSGHAHLPVPLEDVMHLTMRDLSILVAEAEAEVRWEGLPAVLGDRAQLVQLFENLVSNAVKFRRAARPRVTIDAVQERPGWWRIQVVDNGIGIAPEHQDRIFVLFQRLHAREEYEGTGIGLAVCKKIVERHGGRIGVETGPGGVGSRFWFTLPAVAEEKAPEAEAVREGTFDRRIEELV